jgi:hypothetical protein
MMQNWNHGDAKGTFCQPSGPNGWPDARGAAHPARHPRPPGRGPFRGPGELVQVEPVLTPGDVCTGTLCAVFPAPGCMVSALERDVSVCMRRHQAFALPPVVSALETQTHQTGFKIWFQIQLEPLQPGQPHLQRGADRVVQARQRA